jgi:hypothetical protein
MSRKFTLTRYVEGCDTSCAGSPFFEIARGVLRFDHVAGRIGLRRT